jgi:hypothetical protein
MSEAVRNAVMEYEERARTYRQKAEQARRDAANAYSNSSKQQLVFVATTYDDLASQLEQLAGSLRESLTPDKLEAWLRPVEEQYARKCI